MNFKRLLTGTLVCSLAVGLAACGGNGSSTPTPSGNTNSTPAGTKGPDDASKKYTITALDYRYGNPPPSKSPGLDMINQKFNVDYQITYVTNTAYDEKINAVFASGDIPDMVGMMTGDLKVRYNKFAKQGAFLPLDDYIQQYPTLKMVPDYVWDSMRVNGKIYAIPQYSPKYQVVTVIRKDWLDALNLKVPTNYDELKQVALAFTKNDPDKDGKNDTYGIAIGQNINPTLSQGPYWDPDAWYNQDKDGNFIPGIIGPGRKQEIQMFADLYKEGAITKDYATINWADTNKEFYSGKAGIFIGTPRGMSQDYMNGLLKINPKADFVSLPPFTDPNGNTGLVASGGFNGFVMLSAKLANDPGKVKRILEMADYGRKFYPQDQQNDKNPDFDWWSGKVGVAYDMKNNLPVLRPNFASDGLSPSTYFVDNTAWAPKDTDIVYANGYQTKQLVDLVAGIEQMYKGIKLYASPIFGLESPTDLAKGDEARKYVMGEQVKMIAGQRPVSDWDKLVQEFMDKGGAQIVKEYNANIKNKDPKSYFK